MNTELPLSTRLADLTVRKLFQIPFMEKCLLSVYEYLPLKGLLKLAPAHYSYAPETIRHCVRYGICYRVDISSYNGWMLYYWYSKNKDIASFVKEGDIVFDVGANIGEVSLLCAAKVGCNGVVFSFEPNISTFEQLRENSQLNSSLNCMIENLALGSMPGSVKLIQPDERNPGTVTIDSGHIKYGKLCGEAVVMRLDDYIEQKDIQRIDCIKIDVEGFELFVLNGAHKALTRWHPTILLELNDAHQRAQGNTAQEVVKCISSYGYHMFDMMSNAMISPQDNIDNCSCDIYCKVNVN
ncbi:MAG: FkbM family methyltransferase [Verrucomicrobiae bacterium]|nr:FkbM family methyltransferase [Verrucomicrobiae bacterium]